MKQFYYNAFINLLVIFLLSGCAANKPFYNNPSAKNELDKTSKQLGPQNIDYELYLVGDLGAGTKSADIPDIVTLIKSQLKENSDYQSVVFLGNTFPKDGLPDTESPEYQATYANTKRCIAELKENTDKIYFVPGNNEWSDGRKYTVDAVQASEEFLEEMVDGKNIVVPSDGCGEPKIINLTNELVLVLIDSQWLLQGDDSDERQRSSCEIDNEIEFVTALKDVLARNKRKNVIIAAHHPIQSNGQTGGFYPVASHLIPLPILGSVVTAGKKLLGSPQQFGHPQYEAYRSAINTALANFEGVITVSAHDHNLQYHNDGDNHFVVTGSGNEVDYVRRGKNIEFAYMNRGFAKITHTKDLKLWLEFYVPNSKDPSRAKSIYQKRLYKKEVIDFENKEVYKGSEEYPETQSAVAATIYNKKIIGMGKLYRKEWGTIVDAPVLLLDKVDGGLKPVQQGGGFQTKSLRLENPDGRQYVLRTINKDVTKVVPRPLRKTFVKSLIQDGIGAAHPYAAFAIPKMAEAAGIYHANPKFVWLPHQKALGEYDTDFAEKLFLFEERPGGNTVGHPSYGDTKKTVNTPKLIEKLLKNHKHQVDQQHVLRSRLFDVLIGDWDRHDDQWRWGIYEDPDQPDTKIYRAIPRDRDQAFFKNDGFLNYLSSRKWFTVQLRKFEEQVDILEGLIFNARHFDRHFLSQMTRADFVNTAKYLQENVTDEVMADAFADWPKQIYDLNGDVIIGKLKKRRADLVTYAEAFYEHISKEVTVVGTNGQNIFEVEALPNNQLDVKAYHLSKKKKNKHLIWSRVIDGKETKELRLFGLKKKDKFHFKGSHKSSIKVRLIGGSGEDKVINESKGIKILVYDRPDGMKLTGNSVKSKLADRKGINSYDRKDWKLNRSFHFPLITFYTDEGIGVSYNLWWKKFGFRSDPYKSNHTLSASYFFANRSLLGNYAGHFPNLLGHGWDFRLEAEGKAPTFAQFFYGLGNEYINFEEAFPDEADAGSANFHIVRGAQINIKPAIEKNFINGNALAIKPLFEYINLSDTLLEDSNTRFIFLDEADRTAEDFQSKLYTGLGIHFSSQRLNSPALPTRGFVFRAGVDYRQSLSNMDFSNVTLSSNITAYLPLTPSHSVVVATNFGGAYTFGDYEFFHANYLVNQSRLRGYRLNRFAGDGMVYHVTDVRVKLLDGKGAFRTGLGIFGSFDYGRAFLKGEGVDTWHTSFGGGIYLTPLNLLGFKIGYYVGQDDSQLSIGGTLGF